MIAGGSVRRFELALREPLETGAGRIDARAGALLTLRDTEGRRGFGEAAPLPWLPAFADESLDTCVEVLTTFLPRLFGRWPEDVTVLLEEIDRAYPAARFALESALVDLAAQARRIRAADWLAGGRAPHTRVPVNALVTGRDPESVRVSAEKERERGFRTFKLKVGAQDLSEDVKRIDALRSAIGPESGIRLDANGAWSLAEARDAAVEFARFRIEYIEDAMSVRTPDEIARLEELRTKSPIPLAVDDCSSNPELVRSLLAARAADVLILKPSSLGGLSATCALVHAAQQCGMRAVVTSSLDSAVGLSAVLHLAASLHGELPACGLATAGLLAADLACPPAIVGGFMILPTKAGLGIALREPRT